MLARSLSRRIIIAFGLMSLMVAGAFAVGIVASIRAVEEKLVSSDLGSDLQLLLRADNISEWKHRPAPMQLFYYSGGPGAFALPDDLKMLPPGFNEVRRGPEAYHAMVDIIDGRRYVLLQDQRGFEKREQKLFAITLIGLLSSLLLALLLGWRLARRVMSPVIELAAQVRQREQQMLSEAQPLAAGFPGDEVGQLARAFDSALNRLSLALERERLFTSDVSHELRTPLMVLSSSCVLLAESPSLDARARAHVERIGRASRDMRALVETFLLLARSQQGERVGQQLDMRSVADELLAQWSVLIADKGLQLDFQSRSAGSGQYDAVCLRAVMGNLLRNAVHYTERGEIALHLLPSGFVVEDSGSGIPESERNAVFRPFVRGSEQQRDGMGLGLSLVQRICESQGWRVELSSPVNGGSRFTVVLGDGHSSSGE